MTRDDRSAIVHIGAEKTGTEAIRQLLEFVAHRLQLRGSINVQLRKTTRGPVIFEINPRFSSTVMFRHQLGFTDLLWSLQEARGQLPGPQSKPQIGSKFYRVGTEIIVNRI